MYGRVAVALLTMLACWSCTPSQPVRRASAPAVVAVSDRRLLQRLALADPVGGAAPSLPPGQHGDAAPPFTAAASSADDVQRANDCLTAAVYYEARSEPIDGQRAVAQVVLNRVRDRAFPASVCGVVYQRSAGTCQFSFVCDGSIGHPVDDRAWRVAQAVASAALGGSVYASIGAATHYHTTAILPWWAASLARIGTVGSHIFYRWGDRLSGALSFRQLYSGHELARTPVEPAMAATSSAPGYAATADEGGVTVHRGTLAVRPAAAATFGVRVHRGAQPAMVGLPEEDMAAGDDVPAD